MPLDAGYEATVTIRSFLYKEEVVDKCMPILRSPLARLLRGSIPHDRMILLSPASDSVQVLGVHFTE